MKHEKIAVSLANSANYKYQVRNNCGNINLHFSGTAIWNNVKEVFVP